MQKEAKLDWIKVAIAVTPNGEISPTHFGDAERILLARIRPGEYEILDNIISPLVAIEETHGNRIKLNNASNFLSDIQVIATGKPSINFKKLRIEKNKWPMVTDKSPETFLAWLVDNLEQVYNWYHDSNNHIFRVK